MPWKTNFRLRKIGSRSSFSGLLALNHPPVFVDKKVGDNLCIMFRSVCSLFHAKCFRLSDRVKSRVLLTI